MSDKYFNAIFGIGATQTATTITIQKEDLPMTAAAENGGEQCFAALVKKAKTPLSRKGFDDNTEQNILIEDGISGSETRKEGDLAVPYRKFQVVTSFYERDEQMNGGINPDKY